MKRLFCISLFIAVAFPLLGQAIKVEAPNVVAVGEQFNLTFTIDGEKSPTDFNWSTTDDFQCVWGPQKGTSTSISNINGKITKSSTSTYTYVLIALRSGTFTLPVATARIKGGSISSPSHSIQVVSGERKSKPASGSTSGEQPKAERSNTISSEDIYMRLHLSKNEVVVGQGITATLKLYQRVNIAGFEDAHFPSFSGFWTKELQTPSNIEFKRENIGGEIYNTAVLRSWSISPQKAGDLTIEPAELVCLLNVRNQSNATGSLLDMFFQDDYRTIRKRVATPAVTLKVKPLPTDAPASFAGGVGKFTMKAALSTDSLKTHDAASLIVTINGTGNLALLEAPKLNFPPDFEVYDVKTTDTPKGKKFEFPFIPRSHGEFIIGPVEYSYFDIDSGRYLTLRSQPMPLFVQRGIDSETISPTQSGQLIAVQKDVKDLGSDIRYISTKLPSFVQAGNFFVWSPLFWGVLVLLSIMALAYYFTFRKLVAMKADVALTRNRAAVKMAKKRLASAGEYLHKNLYAAFYEELHKALLGFVGDKFGMDASEISAQNISCRLASAGVPEQVAQEFCSLLGDCEYARYSPDSHYNAMSQHYQSAVSVISKIDSCIKKKSDMRHLVAVLLLLAVPFNNAGATSSTAYADSLWTAGNTAYSEGLYQNALDAWEQLYSISYASPQLYTNIADAYFKMGENARAILFYERAIKLDPSFADAHYNLEFARKGLRDRIESVPEFFLVSALRGISFWLPSNTWAIVAIVLFALFLALLLMFLLGRNTSQKKAGFYCSIVALLLFASALGFASMQKADYYKSDSAIITSPVIAVKSAPGAGESKDLFILHEGTKLRLLDAVGEWVNIELADGRQGWVEAKNLEII